jgi:hypothetical protein
MNDITCPCVTLTKGYATFIELAEMFYKDRFDAYECGYSLSICPWLNEFGRSGFRTTFKPHNICESERWFDDYRRSINKVYIDEANDHRVFALLFMHELHKDYLENLQSV